MTHEELVTQLNTYVEAIKKEFPETSKIVLALLAVIQLHKPTDDELCEGCRVKEDDWYSLYYPCPTIQAIEKELL
jgi:hypothetical protein